MVLDPEVVREGLGMGVEKDVEELAVKGQVGRQAVRKVTARLTSFSLKRIIRI